MPAAAHPPMQVRLGWLLGALTLLVVAALCCAYLSLCLLFVQGQWQLLYHPQDHPGRAAMPAGAAPAFTKVHFGANEAGVSELSGWWLPASPGTPLEKTTILYLHDAAGSLSDAQPELARIRALGCAVFAIDYRGYGESAAGHPSEAKMIEDAHRALAYLVDTRHLSESSLILWGRGVGATIAVESSAGKRLPLVLEQVNQPALLLVSSDPRTRLLPVRWLLHDRLDATPALASSDAPKLFLERSTTTKDEPAGVLSVPADQGSSSIGPLPDGTARAYLAAAGPKRRAGSKDETSIRSFLADVGADRH